MPDVSNFQALLNIELDDRVRTWSFFVVEAANHAVCVLFQKLFFEVRDSEHLSFSLTV